MVNCSYCFNEKNFEELKSQRFRFHYFKMLQYAKYKDVLDFYSRVNSKVNIACRVVINHEH
jgi:hypothetical protein